LRFLFAACVDGVAGQRILPLGRVIIRAALELLSLPAVMLVMRSRYFAGNVDRKLRFAKVGDNRGLADVLENLRIAIRTLLICSLGDSSLQGQSVHTLSWCNLATLFQLLLYNLILECERYGLLSGLRIPHISVLGRLTIRLPRILLNNRLNVAPHTLGHVSPLVFQIHFIQAGDQVHTFDSRAVLLVSAFLRIILFISLLHEAHLPIVRQVGLNHALLRNLDLFF
jgi:hypothetical protein